MLNSKILRLLVLAWIMVICLPILDVNAMQYERSFPDEAKRGKLSTTALARLVIDGKLRFDSAALRIYNDDNTIVTIGSVYANNIVINYVENEVGEIVRIWILTAEEARQPLPKKN